MAHLGCYAEPAAILRESSGRAAWNASGSLAWDPREKHRMRANTPTRRSVAIAVDRAIRMVDAGVSLRHAAMVCGVGRSTLKRRLTLRSGPKPTNPRPLVHDAATDTVVVAERCPTCGCLIASPCQACMIRVRKAA